ncbi:phosphate ABC transporter permease subunit PstC [Pantoea sp. Aalb]|uniref:phosphate ABC transporter permease subunit PstC n=1 Tax=Pantoea sp. Aalb TaxID=2576762 RepID=UPI00132ABB8F|nr:phosphate ABC transporter permease subunit PstC [Pantoea sp. Aalb]MXP67624.1 phosphate ABC transporter permease subunit PstC [Pantoea sp. Aalb]
MSAIKPRFKAPGKQGDIIFSTIVKFSVLIILFFLIGIIISLTISSWPSIQKFGFSFLLRKNWDVTNEEFGAIVPIYGTIFSSTIAIIIALPISFGIAFFLTKLAPNWLSRPLGIAIELLAAIPSIVYGMWGLFVFSPLLLKYFEYPIYNFLSNTSLLNFFFSGLPLGIGVLSASIILAVMIMPYMASVMRDVFEQTPSIIEESAYAIGCTTWEVVWRIVLPFTRNGVVGAIILAIGRVLGETMAVTFLIGNTYQMHFSLFTPTNTITSAITNEFAEADSNIHVAALMELALILFVIMFIFIVISKFIILRLSHRDGGSCL